MVLGLPLRSQAESPFSEGYPAFHSAPFCPVLQIASFHRLPFGLARSPTLVAMPDFPES